MIPVSWQQAGYSPETAPYPGKDQDGRGPLWDARTVALCPTHHRNVHQYIIKLMLTGEDDPALALKAARLPKRAAEPQIAYEALRRYVDAGGSLKMLRDRRLLGYA